ncbi:MAG: 4Fe-4S binding protein [Candidatus Acetothermia bacterium]|nr:4Fe-4S binding protein [Candidatus Acetothermia bacterium]
MAASLKGWKELPIGGVIPGGATPELNKTGGWRAERPIWDQEKCIQCLQCWLHCPDDAIRISGQKVTGVDYDYCKGCGVCAAVCPVDAIALEPEREGTCAR